MPRRIALLLFLLFLTVAPVAAAQAQRSAYEELQTFSGVLNYIRLNYPDSVSYSELVAAAIRGMLRSLDPHSRFESRVEFERQRAAEATGDDPTALFDYAAALFNVQRTIDAEEPLRRAVGLNPRYAPAHYLLGRVHEELGLGAEARDSYTKFLAVAPHRLRDLIADAQQRLAKVQQ